MTNPPIARTRGIGVVTSGDDLLLLDDAQGHIHALNSTAASIWRLCDGSRSPAQIAVDSGFEAPAVELAIGQFADLDLLESRGAGATISRRDVVRRLVAAGIAAGVLLPVISSISVHEAAAGPPPVSCLPIESPCTITAQCCQPGISACLDGFCLLP